MKSKQNGSLNKLIVVTIVAAISIIAGCAPSMMVPVTRPAEINLRGINKIAIGEIRGNGGQVVSDLLTSKLFESGKFEVVDRANMDRIMREHSLNLSGTVDDKTAAQLGKLVGAAVLVFGNISTYKYDLTKTVGDPWQDKEGKRHQTHYVKGTAKVTASLQVVGLTTGAVLAAKTISKETEEKNSADNGWPEAPDQDAIVGAAVNATVDAFIKMIAPYTDYVKVTFAKADSKLPELERGINFAKAGQWPDAVEQFKAATAKDPTHQGAQFNLGLAYEYTGQFDKAEDTFKTANKIESCDKCIAEISNVKRLAADRKKLEAQGALNP